MFPLTVPRFARVDEYAGIWAITADAMTSLRERASGLDWKSHMQAAAMQGPVRSSLERAKSGDKNVAIISVLGTLMKGQMSMGGTSTIQLRRDIRTAVADKSIDAIVLAIDSPGGTVSGTSDLADEVKAARKSKPVVAHIEDLGCSAAYWVASQAERITVNSPTALVGSIGTLQVIYDQSEAAAKEGVKVLVFKTGPFKGLGTPGAAVTQEQIDHTQKLVDSVQKSFDAAVMNGRKMTPTELAAVRHGGVFTGSEARDLRLVDAVQPFAATLAQLGSGRAPSSTLPMVRGGTLPMLSRHGRSSRPGRLPMRGN